MPDIRRSAEFSDDRVYRYRLTREWGSGPRGTFVMLNPSTADEHGDDPTIRRCIGFARTWGWGGLNIVNVYALRATYPKDLWRIDDPVGPENERHLVEAADDSAQVVAAWGVHAKAEHVTRVLELPGFDRLTCLRTTKHGHPSHPLYLPKTLRPVWWPIPEDR